MREDSNVESAAKFVEAGYKDGLNFIGAVSLSNNIFVIKANDICYRVTEEYPRWSVVEVAKNIRCRGRRSYCAVGDDVFVLGAEAAHWIQPTYYGNVKPDDIAALVKSEIHKLPRNAQVRYVPPLNQIWCIGRGGYVLIFDTLLKSWYKRQFNSEILDVFNAGDAVFIVKLDRISKLDKGTSKDSGEYLPWRFFTQRLVSHHDFLLKRSKVSVTPFNREHYSGYFFCGRVKLPIPIPDAEIKVFGNDSPIFANKMRVMWQGRRQANILPQLPNEEIFDSEQISGRRRARARRQFFNSLNRFGRCRGLRS